MSELNLDNIVGFKAVDKDGNEQNVTVDEMVDMVATRMVSALSETSSLSEISTLATAAATGNDVYENELPTVTDAANVRVLQSSGDAAQMTMQSLATKLGGLLGVNDTWFRYRNSISGVNDLTEFKNSGAYMLYDVTFDLSYKYGSLIVLNCGSQIVQFTFAFHSNALHIRTNWNNEKWTNWQTVSLT